MSRVAIDTTRLYLAGFSGTARQIWDFAAELPANVAGVIGVRRGTAEHERGLRRRLRGARGSFAFFGGAGEERLQLRRGEGVRPRSSAGTLAVRFAEYAGPHAWPPAAICGAALEWMHCRAMLSGHIALDSAFVIGRIAAELDSARRSNGSAQLAKAAVAYPTHRARLSAVAGRSRGDGARAALASNRAVRDYLGWSATSRTRSSGRRRRWNVSSCGADSRMERGAAHRGARGRAAEAARGVGRLAAGAGGAAAPRARTGGAAFYEPRDHLAQRQRSRRARAALGGEPDLAVERRVVRDTLAGPFARAERASGAALRLDRLASLASSPDAVSQAPTPVLFPADTEQRRGVSRVRALRATRSVTPLWASFLPPAWSAPIPWR